MSELACLLEKSWCSFPFDPRLQSWIDATLPAAMATLDDPANARWWRYQDTWFAGVNVLENDANGAVSDGPALAGTCIDFIVGQLGVRDLTWDKAQVSVCRPGYPKPMPGESDAQHRFRLTRDAAHVDGLLGAGRPRRRFLREPHAFILGIPMVNADAEASPLVVWEGSHEIFRAALKAVFDERSPSQWTDTDLTDVYKRTRNLIFENCRRVKIHAQPGEAYIVHRLALHGVAPWAANAAADHPGRMICYFRPLLANIGDWLDRP